MSNHKCTEKRIKFFAVLKKDRQLPSVFSTFTYISHYVGLDELRGHLLKSFKDRHARPVTEGPTPPLNEIVFDNDVCNRKRIT